MTLILFIDGETLRLLLAIADRHDYDHSLNPSAVKAVIQVDDLEVSVKPCYLVAQTAQRSESGLTFSHDAARDGKLNAVVGAGKGDIDVSTQTEEGP